MKRLSIFALVFVLAMCLVACGGRNDEGTNNDASAPTDHNTVLPDMNPTSGTNVPDPNVNGNSTDGNNENGIVDDFMDPTQGNNGNNGTGNNGTGGNEGANSPSSGSTDGAGGPM